MDVLWTLQNLVPSPRFGGTIEHDAEAEYNALVWLDTRPKPTWSDLQSAWPAAQKTMITLLTRLETIFDGIPQNDASVPVRVYFRGLQGIVRRCLEASPSDVEAARFVIQTATLPGDTYVPGYTLPAELAVFQQALLNEF